MKKQREDLRQQKEECIRQDPINNLQLQNCPVDLSELFHELGDEKDYNNA
jgi:hypothetical protein